MFIFLIILIIFILLRHLKRLYILKKQNIINKKYKSALLIAHPDDEIMFFCPLILSTKIDSIICLSNGNFYQKGKKREKELEEISKALNVKVYIGSFEDNEDWNDKNIIEYIDSIYNQENFNIIYTFDKFGVSNHKNHISCFRATKKFIKQKKIFLATLKSKSLFMKYIIDYKRSGMSFSLGLKNYFKPISLMMTYKSQMIWFRYFYILFSNYTIYNDFDLMY
ncbi:N-acetylglucosaminyl-phosphatidylinositol de-N-acetylase [Dictyocoela muelleri]|nr:N-acetylglucosaminyl-phosphatidylinositol de-N-acetylase [Dictyocoela muelleri]